MKILKVGICGWGNVATGMFNAIESNNKFIKQSGVNIAISCIGARRDNPKCNPGNVPVFRDIFVGHRWLIVVVSFFVLNINYCLISSFPTINTGNNF